MPQRPPHDRRDADGRRTGTRPVTAPGRRRARRRAGALVAGTAASAALVTGTLLTCGGDTGPTASAPAPAPTHPATSTHPPAPTHPATPTHSSAPATLTRSSAPTTPTRPSAPAAPVAPEPAVAPAVPWNTPRAVGAETGGAEARGAAAEYARRVVALTNAARAKAGCAPLRVDPRLRAAAQGHADDMAARGYYGHAGPGGHDAGDRMEAAGYGWRAWGENIHRGPRSPARAVRDWMASEGHRKNVMNCRFTDIGVGVSLRSNGPWWVQDFGAAG
ncbi:CAP domain-containing protein [Streptomyces sp. NPDC016309]|uniref:CAP domain-containing protein n=1 Tax=Streptomyces sp. NPDC016309 TaxID=3364965 RepID=UPI0036FF9E4E